MLLGLKAWKNMEKFSVEENCAQVLVEKTLFS